MRQNQLRTARFLRSTKVPSTAQILALAHLRRGIPLPDELFAALIPSEQELGRRVFAGAWPLPAETGERPR